MSERRTRRTRFAGRGLTAALALALACAAAASAAAARTSAPPGRVSREPPRVTPKPPRSERAAWRAALGWPDRCEEEFEAAYAGGDEFGGLEFHRLGRGLHLVEVTCDGGGVQPSSVFALYEERRPRRARLLRLKGFGGEDARGRPLPYSEVRALTKFVPRTRELLLMSKADAMGTCGLYVRYRFEGGRPRVVEAREQTDCGGPRATPDTSRWPRARLK